jgi:hypothetical protein
VKYFYNGWVKSYLKWLLRNWQYSLVVQLTLIQKAMDPTLGTPGETKVLGNSEGSKKRYLGCEL